MPRWYSAAISFMKQHSPGWQVRRAQKQTDKVEHKVRVSIAMVPLAKIAVIEEDEEDAGCKCETK